MSKFLVRDPWENLRRLTPAPIALGRAGTGLPTKEVLDFSLRHARAHDAVLAPLDVGAVDAAIRAHGFETVRVRSAAPDRGVYLRRPDLGRRLHPDDAALLKQRGGDVMDIAFIVADGLSSAAIHGHATAFLNAAKPHLARKGWRVAPVAIATQARVALGDEIASLLRARFAIVLIGERPGLSSPDSLGIYLTCDPKIGRTDAERNCISNIHAAGLDYQAAAHRVFWLVEEGLRLGKTGVALKDMSDLTALGSADSPNRSRTIVERNDAMADTIEGGCRCGRIRYRTRADKLPNAYACHCRDCQTWSGSAFSLQFILPEDQLEVTGEPQLYELTSPESGRTSRQRGCPICFTRIYNTNSARPGLAVVRAGTLDRSDELKIAAHIWTKRKLAGITIPDDLPSWPESAPPADFIAALSRE